MGDIARGMSSTELELLVGILTHANQFAFFAIDIEDALKEMRCTKLLPLRVKVCIVI